jgi:hypothetical protein
VELMAKFGEQDVELVRFRTIFSKHLETDFNFQSIKNMRGSNLFEVTVNDRLVHSKKVNFLFLMAQAIKPRGNLRSQADKGLTLTLRSKFCTVQHLPKMMYIIIFSAQNHVRHVLFLAQNDVQNNVAPCNICFGE